MLLYKVTYSALQVYIFCFMGIDHMIMAFVVMCSNNLAKLFEIKKVLYQKTTILSGFKSSCQIKPCPKQNRYCNGFMVIMGKKQ